MTASDVLSTVRISDIWRALGGPQLRRAGKDRYRGRGFWRNGDGWNISLDDSRGAWFDHRDAVGGGVLDLIVHVRGGSRQDALRWLADYQGTPLDDRPLSAAERARMAAE